MNFKLVILVPFLILLFFNGIWAMRNPYEILGVAKHASLGDIRKAYKQLAKEWHPDKSSHPEAENKFVEIKQAYELLIDPDRRKLYDQHGITNEDSTLYKQRSDYSQYGRFNMDPFEEFFGFSKQFDGDMSLFHKLTITSKYYEHQVLPKSKTTPHLLFFYSDWCFACLRAAGSFKKLIDSLENLGVVFAAINAGHENQLIRKAGIHSLPSLSLVLDEHNYIYKEPSFSVQRIVDFIRNKLPYKLIPSVDDGGFDDYLNGWADNRVRALIFEPRQQPRLRYLLSAYYFRSRVAFGFIDTSSTKSPQLQEQFKIHPNLDTLLLFNEDKARPVASISMTDIPSQTLNNVISNNQYLALPRLSSQEILEGVCPADFNRPKKKLCVVLITENSYSHDFAREALRRMSMQSSYKERVRYAYIFREKQSDFINALSVNSGSTDTLLKLVVIWRRDNRHIKYEWVNDSTLHLIKDQENITSDVNFNVTKLKIDEVVQRLLRTSEALPYEAEVKELFDEHSQNLATRILKKVFITIDYFYDNLGKEHLLAILSVVGTVGFIVGVGYLMSYLVRLEEENIQKNEQKSNGIQNGKTNSNYVPELKLHELRAEKYNGLVRLLKPGCRTIVLLTDVQSRNKLIPAYHKAVWPYRKNKTLMFSYMHLEKGLSWYSELLRLSLTESRDLDINPRNCIGTVIALNGHRKYFCMYHAKHPETNRGKKRMLQMAKQLSFEPNDPEAGAFLGLESEDSDPSTDVSEPKILLEENLLDGLSNWLDRLFEGSTHRYYINYWPDFTTK